MAIDGDDIYGRKSGRLKLRSQTKERLWPSFVTLFWPKKVKASKLEEIHAKMVMKEAAPRTDTSTPKKPRTSASAKTNGTASSSSGRANGKPHR